MSVALDLIMHSPSVDMYGEPDRSSAYSLSGHVTITLHPSFSFFDPRRTTTYLLKSLNLALEGQTELIASNFGYTALRLCEITREIAPAEPVELSNDGQEDIACRWNITFDIPVPGWLPATTEYSGEGLGITYTLYAQADIISMDDPNASQSIFSALCTPFRSKERTIRTSKAIVLKRFIDSHFLDKTQIPQAVYLINSKFATSGEIDRLHIPESILNKIQVISSVPEFVDIDAASVALSVRLRTQGLGAEECRRLEVTAFSMDVVQCERCRYRPTEECRRRLPLPRDHQQPPNLALRTTHDLGLLYDEFCETPKEDATQLRETSLLHKAVCGEFKLVGDCHIFVNDHGDENPSWYTLDTTIPMCAPRVSRHDDDKPALHATIHSPLVTITHEIRMSLQVVYQPKGNAEKTSERLTFAIPLKFVCLPPPPPVTAPSISMTVRSQVFPTTAAYSSAPYAETSALPAYSQLFHSNGDRKNDFTPLPRYTPKDSAGTTAESISNATTSTNPEPTTHDKTNHLVNLADDNESTVETDPLL